MAASEKSLSHRLIERSLSVLLEKNFIPILRGEDSLPDGSKSSPTLMSGSVAVLSICDEAIAMGLPKNEYASLYIKLTELIIPTLQHMEKLSTIEELKAYINRTYKESTAKSVLEPVCKINAASFKWEDEFKLEPEAIQKIESIPQWSIFLSKIVLIIKIISIDSIILILACFLQCMSSNSLLATRKPATANT